MLRHRTYLRYQDWKYGIHTEAVVLTNELGFVNPEFHDYGASDWHHLRRLIKRLRLDYQSHVFVDFGAGMGRAVIAAAAFPFKRVIGVELSPQLAAIARQNIQRASSKLACPDVRIVNADASDLVIDPEMTVFYFFNPFHGATLDTVLMAIRTSLVSAPRTAWVICRLPRTSEFESQILQADWLQKQDELALKNGIKYWTFESHLGNASDSG